MAGVSLRISRLPGGRGAYDSGVSNIHPAACGRHSQGCLGNLDPRQTSFGYDENSNLTTQTFPAASGVVDTFIFDRADKMSRVSSAQGATTLFSAPYTRDAANQLTSDGSAPAANSAYKYTPLNQLCYAGSASTTACSSPPSGSIPYKYDAADNLVQTGSTQQVFNNADQLCWTASTTGSCSTPPSGATRYQYDARGNRTIVTPAVGTVQTLTYDQANRLIKYAAASTTSYGYNGDGLRMCKYSGSSTSPCQATGSTQHLWDVAGSLPLMLMDGNIAYIYGPGGLPLEQVSGSTTYWVHHDQIGSTRLITDSTGISQTTYTFDPYGNLIASIGTVTNPFRFAGQYLDSESGFYYLRARYYDPATGQFVSVDSAVAVSRAPYQYVAGSPLNQTDATGLLGGGFCAEIRAEAGGAGPVQGGNAFTAYLRNWCLIGLVNQHGPSNVNITTGSADCHNPGTDPNNSTSGGGGLFAGIGVNFVITNANTREELEGPAHTVNFNAGFLAAVGGSFSWDDRGVWSLSIARVGFGFGLSFSHYDVINHVVGSINTSPNLVGVMLSSAGRRLFG